MSKWALSETDSLRVVGEVQRVFGQALEDEDDVDALHHLLRQRLQGPKARFQGLVAKTTSTNSSKYIFFLCTKESKIHLCMDTDLKARTFDFHCLDICQVMIVRRDLSFSVHIQDLLSALLTVIDHVVSLINDDDKKVEKEEQDENHLLSSFSNSKLASFVSSIRRMSATNANGSVHRSLFVVPFRADLRLEGDERLLLNLTCSQTLASTSSKVEQLRKSTFSASASLSPLQTLEKELEWWVDRRKDVSECIEHLRQPWLLRAITQLQCQTKHDTYNDDDDATSVRFELLEKSLEELAAEADNNKKVLDVLHSQATVIDDDQQLNMDVLGQCMRTVLRTLRAAWTFSEHHRSESVIISLIGKVTPVILGRVRRLSNLTLSADLVSSNTKFALTLMRGWKKSFDDTKRAIENSEREERWQFHTSAIFKALDHAIGVCSDLRLVAECVCGIWTCFSSSFKTCTLESEGLASVERHVSAVMRSFTDISYDIFEQSVSHHWTHQMAFFKREVKFIELSARAVIKSSFEQLKSAHLGLLAINYARDHEPNDVIFALMMDRADDVVQLFIREMKSKLDNFLKDDNTTNDDNDRELPPVARAIGRADALLSGLMPTVNLIEELPEVRTLPTWQNLGLITLDEVRAFVREERNRQHQQWSQHFKASVLDSLKRPLLLKKWVNTKVSNEGVEGNKVDEKNMDNDMDEVEDEDEKVVQYEVNFTSQLYETLAEIRYLEQSGFAVAEIAKTMRADEHRVTQLAHQLKAMTNRLNDLLRCQLDVLERNLLKDHISNIERVLEPGATRITWNSQSIPQFIKEADNHVCTLNTIVEAMQRIEQSMVKNLKAIEDTVLFTRASVREKRRKRENVHFRHFHTNITLEIKANYKICMGHVESLGLCMLQLEELVSSTRTLRSPTMSAFYVSWEHRLFTALSSSVLRNLQIYGDLLINSRQTLFVLKAELYMDRELRVEPNVNVVLDGLLDVAKSIVEGTKNVSRRLNNSWIPVNSVVRRMTDLNLEHHSMYTEIRHVSSIRRHVEGIQSFVVAILRRMTMHLDHEWLLFDKLYLIDKQITSDTFASQPAPPTCADFDEKMLFYFNIGQNLRRKEQHRTFAFVKLDLSRLQTQLLDHAHQWVTVLSSLLENSAQHLLEEVQQHIQIVEAQLSVNVSAENFDVLMNTINQLNKQRALDIDLKLADVLERCRTVNIYTSASYSASSSLSSSARQLEGRWHDVRVKGQRVMRQLTHLWRHQQHVLTLNVSCLLRKLDHVLHTVSIAQQEHEDGQQEQQQQQCLQQRVCSEMRDECLALNERQRLLLMPVTHFRVMDKIERRIQSKVRLSECLRRCDDALTSLSGDFRLKLNDPDAELRALRQRETLKELWEEMANTNLQDEEQRILQTKLIQVERMELLLNTSNQLRVVCVIVRHWQLLDAIMGVRVSEVHTLSQLTNLDELKLQESTEHLIHEVLQQEEQCKREMEEAFKAWNEEKIEFVEVKIANNRTTSSNPSVANVVANLDPLIRALELDLKVLADMEGQFEKRFESVDEATHTFVFNMIKVELKALLTNLRLLDPCQRLWLKLMRIQNDGDSRFRDESELFLKLLNDLSNLQDERLLSVADISVRSRLQHSLNSLQKLEKLRTCEWVEKALSELPRLVFLSSAQVIDILGGHEGNEKDYEKALIKLLGHHVVKSLRYSRDKSTHFVDLINLDDDELNIVLSAEDGNDGLVLAMRVVEEVRQAVRRDLLQGFEVKAPRIEDITLYVYSHKHRMEANSLIHLEVIFTAIIEKALFNDHKREVSKQLRSIHGSLRGLTDSVEVELKTDKENGLHNRRRNHFLSWLKSKTLLLLNLLWRCPSSSHFFHWRQQLRFYYTDNHQSVEVHTANVIRCVSFDMTTWPTIPDEDILDDNHEQQLMEAAVRGHGLVLVKGDIIEVQQLIHRLAFKTSIFTDVIDDDDLEEIEEKVCAAIESGCWMLLKTRSSKLISLRKLALELKRAREQERSHLSHNDKTVVLNNTFAIFIFVTDGDDTNDKGMERALRFSAL